MSARETQARADGGKHSDVEVLLGRHKSPAHILSIAYVIIYIIIIIVYKHIE